MARGTSQAGGIRRHRTAGLAVGPGSGTSPSGHQFLAFLACACAASHSALVSSRKPAPLHAFWPLQEFLAVLQADWPLQAFTPSHFTCPSSAAAALTETVANITAAAAARAKAVVLRALIGNSFEGTCRQLQ